MLQFRQAAVRRGPRVLFENVDLTIHPGQKVGVVGANGCGKSSLLAVLRGELELDRGDLQRPDGWVLAHVAQETPAVDDPAVRYVMAGDAELANLEQALVQAEADGDGNAIARIHVRLDAIDGYSAYSRASRLLAGLGFAPDAMERPVRAFSGGWRMRLNLARALMCRSDLLLLDEPTNHLDLDAVVWLEGWLQSYPGTMLLIAHDRDFLDACVDRIAHVADGTITLYTGNYTAFERARAARLEAQAAQNVKLTRERAHLMAFVDRFRAKATKARQVQSRLKHLERMAEVAPVHAASPFHFAFRPPEKLPNPLIQLEDVACGYGDAAIIQGVSLTLQPGDRLGILGRNGAGKSTLLKVLAGKSAAIRGVRREAEHLRIGYFAQHQLEQLRSDWSPVRHLQALDPALSEQLARNFLGGFGFSGDMAQSRVEPFSGGEKARLVLALLVYRRPNLLLLDEPTNHLDLEMREALNIALQDFDGALVLVSHDRYLLSSVTDRFLRVSAGKVTLFNDDLDAYRTQLAAELRDNGAERPASGGDRREQRRQSAEQRQALARRRKPLQVEQQRLEKALAPLQAEKKDLEAWLASPEAYLDDNKPKLAEAVQRQGALIARIEELEGRWLTVEAELDALSEPALS